MEKVTILLSERESGEEIGSLCDMRNDGLVFVFDNDTQALDFLEKEVVQDTNFYQHFTIELKNEEVTPNE